MTLLSFILPVTFLSESQANLTSQVCSSLVTQGSHLPATIRGMHASTAKGLLYVEGTFVEKAGRHGLTCAFRSGPPFHKLPGLLIHRNFSMKQSLTLATSAFSHPQLETLASHRNQSAPGSSFGPFLLPAMVNPEVTEGQRSDPLSFTR